MGPRGVPFYYVKIMPMVIVVLALLGICFGSFVNALVWRLHQQENLKTDKQRNKYSIRYGRSMCVHCGHKLHVHDLIPVFSWLSLRGKCRYCKKPISWQYPAVELVTAALFVSSYVFWPQVIAGLEVVHFAAWLVCLTGFVALVVYDIRWMLLPNKIVFFLYGVAGVDVVARIVQQQSFNPLLGAITAILIGGGIFYVLFQLSEGRWIGGGDVKLGFLLGALVGAPLEAVLFLFIASLLGCIITLPLLASGRASRSTRIPFGPFLITGCIITVLFGRTLIGWYADALLI